MPDKNDPWFDYDNDANKQPRKDAADAFLKRALTDTAFRKKVLENPADAKDEFDKLYRQQPKGDKGIPDTVKVICVDPDLNNLDNGRACVVVFCLPTLPTEGAAPKNPIGPRWQEGWLAAWLPY